ncbi:alanine racemase [Parafrigoribacterium soli]|uniref:alanine racemase n=1 Tax=Parafrigoribacterium soli TaxID=3144663 RepID=UPI0032EBFCBA
MTATPTPRVTAQVDLGAYRRNLSRLIRSVSPSKVMAVVKADAYGHGLVPIARAAVGEGVEWLGALDTQTALELRSADIDPGTNIFAWHLAPEENCRPVIDARIDLGISTIAQLEQIAAAGAQRAARLHLKIDTGLHRNGALRADWPALVRRARELEQSGVAELYGAWTHIAEASYDEDSAAIALFEDAVAEAEALGARFSLLHLAASAAGLSRQDSRFGLVRFGAFGYGISPGDGITAAELGLEPVLTLVSTTVVDADGSVVVPVGYGDGISSLADGRVQLCVEGELVDVARVESDRMILSRAVRADAEVILFGAGKQGEWTLQQWADATGTIGEEIVTRLVSAIPREYRE